MNKSAMRSIFLFVIISFSLSGHILSQDAVRVAEPPIVKIELSGVEPLPDGVAKLMGFGSPAGGGGFDDFQPNDGLYWEFAPSIVYPQIPERPRDGIYFGSTFVACGYPVGSYPEVIVTSPSGKTEKVTIVESGDCWQYYQTWSYGMELGEYKLVAEHRSGTMRHSWFVEYTPSPMVGLISDKNGNDDIQTRLLMGFEPNEKIVIHIYSEEVSPNLLPNESPFDYTSSTNIGGYVATRLVEVDDNGALILDFSTTVSSPFSAAPLGFIIDGYSPPPVGTGVASPALRDYSVTKVVGSERPEIEFYASVPSSLDDALKFDSIWKNINFIDMKSPGTQRYSISLEKDFYRVGFTWCADTTDRLENILAPFELTVSVNETPLTIWDIMRFDEGVCRKWLSVLKPEVDVLEITFHYSLSEDIFDGTATYKAGDYFHIIDATFQ